MEKMKLNNNQKNIIACVTFCAVFAILLIIATFKDLEVSKILASKALSEHKYITNKTVFGMLGEIVGSNPVYMLFAVCFQIIGLYVYRKTSDWKRIVFPIILFIFSVVAFEVMVSDTKTYIVDHIIANNENYQEKTGFLFTFIYYLVGAILAILLAFFLNKLKTETVEKLLRFAIAGLVVAAIPTILINVVIKKPVGRIRFRAMNINPDDPTYGFSAFARWYEVHGQWISKENMQILFGSTDALKSFPSGHTSSAACVYALIMLIDSLEIKNKKIVISIWVGSILYTMLVAISRIVVGAHFMSDVLVGGTMTFLVMIFSREIIINKCKNIKSIFKKENA